MLDTFETPYEDETPTEYIHCIACNKSIRGHTLYKIHCTLPRHLKNEDKMISKGLAVRDRIVPDFKDIVQYLKYLELDEPIIGLKFLEEMPRGMHDPDTTPGPNYHCMLCDSNDGNMTFMVSHVIGRKHRQKYLEAKRGDLVTWEKNSTQPGRMIRAKAEIVERQDGQGTPLGLRKYKNPGKLNVKVAYRNEDFYEGANSPHFHQDDPYMMADLRRKSGPWDGPPRRDPRNPTEPEARRAEYRDRDGDRDVHRRDDDYHREYQENYGGDMPRGIPERGGVPRPGFREEMKLEEGYPGEAYPENDPLKQFYSDEVKRERVCSTEAADPRWRPGPAERDPHSYPPGHPEQGYPLEPPCERADPDQEPRRIFMDYSHGSGAGDERSQQRAADTRRGHGPEDHAQRRAYPEDQPVGPGYPEAEPHNRRSLDRDPNRHGNANGADRQGADDPETKRRNSYIRDNLLEMVKAFRQERRGPQQEGPEGGPGPRFRGPPPSSRPPGGARVVSDIPEPFKRFLERSEAEEDHGKRRKKSRFSDATKEEMEVVQGILPYPQPQTRGPPRPGHGPRRPEVPGPPRPGSYAQSQGPYQAESYPRGGSTTSPAQSSNSGNVLDVLNNIEIENVEEADFLKNKLCSLLKEFQAKKSEKAVHHGPPVISKDYNHLSQDAQESPRGQYDRGFRGAPEDRGFREAPEDHGFREAPEDRGFREAPEDRGFREAPEDRGFREAPEDRGFREAPEDRGFREAPEDRGFREAPEDRGFREAPEDRGFREAPEDRGFREAPEDRGFREAPEDRGFREAPEDRGFREAPEGRGFREAPEGRGRPRRPQEPFPPDHRVRGWEEPQQEEEERFQEYSPPPFHPELRASNRRRYEEVFGQGGGQFPTPRGRPAEEPQRPGRFQEPMRPRDFLPPPAFRGGEYRMHGTPQHSSSLDKITSTLLELVARK